MFGDKTVHLVLSLVFYSSVTVFGQWTAATSGTTNNLNGAYLLDSGVGFVVGDAGTIVKTTNAGMTWSPLTSGTTNALYDVYFFDGTQGVAVGEQGLIRRTTDGGAGWQTVASGVKDGLRSVSFSGGKRNRRWRLGGHPLFDRCRRFVASRANWFFWAYPQDHRRRKHLGGLSQAARRKLCLESRLATPIQERL